MKKLLILFVLFSITIQAQSRFDLANDLYKKGNYADAIEEYESILQTKKHAAEVYFNLANCYYKTHKVAPAIYNYEKALLLKPNDLDIQTNLKFAQKLQIDDIKEVPRVGFSKLITNFTASYHYDTWAWISVVLAFLFLGFFVGYYFAEKTIVKRSFFVLMFLVIISIAITISSGIYERNLYRNDRPAIVFAELTTLKTEPKADANDAFVLHEGSKVYVLETVDNWKKVQLTDGKKGWIPQNSIKELK